VLVSCQEATESTDIDWALFFYALSVLLEMEIVDF
jgi:hypothetical protein